MDSDQYLTAPRDQQPHILTSVLKRVDVAVVRLHLVGRRGKPLTGYATYDLKTNGVGYATSGGFVDDIKAQLDDYADEDQERRHQGADGPVTSSRAAHDRARARTR